MKTHSFLFSTVWAAALAPAFCAVAAQPLPEPSSTAELQPVQIEAHAAPPVRFDVKAACPTIEGDLQRTVGPAWGRFGVAGKVRVQFRVENERVTDVSASGVSDYRPYIRRAVAKLACNAGSAQVQDFRFLLVIRDPDEEPAPDRFAVLEAD